MRNAPLFRELYKQQPEDSEEFLEEFLKAFRRGKCISLPCESWWRRRVNRSTSAKQLGTQVSFLFEDLKELDAELDVLLGSGLPKLLAALKAEATA